MAIRTAKIQKLHDWLKENPNASWREFVEKTGGTQDQFYHARKAIGLSSNNENVSKALKKVHRKKRNQLIKAQTITLPVASENKIAVEKTTLDMEEVLGRQRREIHDLRAVIAYLESKLNKHGIAV